MSNRRSKRSPLKAARPPLDLSSVEPVGIPRHRTAFLKATPWEDEYFVIVDTGRPPGGTVIQTFTTDIAKVPKNFLIGGVTPDSIYVGLDYLKESANRRKLLLLFGGSLNADPDFAPTTGLDPNHVVAWQPERSSRSIRSSPTDNGGTTFDDVGTIRHRPTDRGRIVLRSRCPERSNPSRKRSRRHPVQYFIGYRATNEAKDGKWRRIKVNVNNAPEEAGKLSVWTRSGYYAEKQKKPKG